MILLSDLIASNGSCTPISDIDNDSHSVHVFDSLFKYKFSSYDSKQNLSILEDDLSQNSELKCFSNAKK